MSARTLLAPGPFRAEHIREGSPYELSNGHPILCMPTGRRGGVSNLLGGSVVGSDPAVESAGVDVGFSQDPSHLRAPDVSVGHFAAEPGWAKEAPPLAIEYADTGQDEEELQKKIEELLQAGSQFVWVVRLIGPRRVEVYEPTKKMRLAHIGEELTAPGILKNPVPVLALFDKRAAYEATLRNLLQRQGYESIDAIRDEGVAEGIEEGKRAARREALLDVLAMREMVLSDEDRRRILEETNLDVLRRWTRLAMSASSTSFLHAAS